MTHRKFFNISKLMYIPIALVLAIYGVAVWVIVKVVEHVAREVKRIESNDSVHHKEGT